MTPSTRHYRSTVNGNRKVPTEARATNLETEGLVTDRLREHGLLETAGLEVRIRQGVAYLKGIVANWRQKRLVGEVASQVEGVHGIVNMLRVAPLTVVDDDTLRERIRQALARAPLLAGASVSVEVVSSVVYLEGLASTATEKHLAEGEAWSVAGVKDVANRIEVPPESLKSEALVAREILRSLCSRLGMDPRQIAVRFRNGIVHLQGTVPSSYLKAAAEEMVRWVPRVVGVVNDLSIPSQPSPRGHLDSTRPPAGACPAIAKRLP